MRRMHAALLLLLLIGFTNTLWAQTAQGEDTPEPERYEIRSVEYVIDGYTRKSVLIHYLKIEKGETFESKEALDAYIADKVQMIKNQRTLEGGSIETSFGRGSDEQDKVYVNLLVEVSDTWNYLLLPYGKYDSNEGLLLSLRGRNYNFFGGMEALELNLDYTRTDNNTNEYSVNGQLSTPFYWLGYEWMFDFKEDVTIKPDEPNSFSTQAGLSVDIPTDFVIWQASVEQSYELNKEGEDDPDTWYLKTEGRFGSSIPLGFELPGFSEVYYNPAMITSVAYRPGETLSEERRGYELGGEHGITTGRINWKKNFRDGAELTFTQDARWNFDRDRWLSDFDAELLAYKALGFMGLSSRIAGFYRYGGEKDNAGDMIRGILDNRLEGNAAIYGNFDFPIKLWIWFFDRWFEGHISPFFDYALVHPAQNGTEFEDPWYSGGIEAFAFLKQARSIYLRMSLGVDLEAMRDGASLGESAPRDGEPIYELYIGLGHHY